jgi:hypothetical protein
MVLLGAGLGLFHPPNNKAVLAAVTPMHLGVATGFFSTVNVLTGFVGQAMSAEILGDYLAEIGGVHAIQQMLGAVDPPALVAAYLSAEGTAYITVAALAFVGMLLSALRGNPSPVAEPAPGRGVQ